MRLLVVSQYFWPEDFRINELVANLVKRGHQVTVLTGVPNYPDGNIFQRFRDSPSSHAHYEGADIVRVPMMARGQNSLRLILNYLTFAISASIVGLWKLRGREFDVIFAYEPSPITVGLPAATMRRVKKAPLAFWVLDLWPETLHALGIVRSPVLLKTVGKLVGFIYRRCDLILAQSRSFVPQIRKYAGDARKIVYFPNWAEPVAAAEQTEPADCVPLQSGSFSVMFAGNIGEAQDFPAILGAAEILKTHQNIRWLIVGDGRMAVWVQEEIKRRGLEARFHLLGRHAPDRMPAFFKHADALLVSLKSEPIFAMTIPGKLQSYLAAGKPILAALDGEGAELVRSSYSGLTCAAGDAVGLAAIVLKLSKLPILERDQMGQNGRLVSIRDFDRENLIDGLEENLRLMRNEVQRVGLSSI
ncbi:MAG: glycosyltransferase WbuB [Burkholderiales bacterium PBB3]|nr:MAG: glycosyltransferase WbuB [Burkholderiales bacterium PBB3]